MEVIQKPKSLWGDPNYRAHQYEYYSRIIKCDVCNCEFSRSHKDRHQKSKKHLNMINMRKQILDDLKAQVKLKINQKIKLLDDIRNNLETS